MRMGRRPPQPQPARCRHEWAEQGRDWLPNMKVWIKHMKCRRCGQTEDQRSK